MLVLDVVRKLLFECRDGYFELFSVLKWVCSIRRFMLMLQNVTQVSQNEPVTRLLFPPRSQICNISSVSVCFLRGTCNLMAHRLETTTVTWINHIYHAPQRRSFNTRLCFSQTMRGVLSRQMKEICVYYNVPSEHIIKGQLWVWVEFCGIRLITTIYFGTVIKSRNVLAYWL